MRMGKISLSNIAEELAVRNGIAREAADNFMHAFVETIEKGLQEDGMVKVKGLGTFKLQEVSDRGSVDVNTGERITIKGYRKVTFTPDSAMKELVNRPFAHFEPTELNDGYPTEEEWTTSDDVPNDNGGVEVAEESVETMEEETVAVIETLREEVTETVVTSLAVETVADELVAEDVVEDVVEKGVEQSAPGQESVSVQEEVAIRKEASEKEPKKRRSLGCLITSFLLLALAAILAFALFLWLSVSEDDEIKYEDAYEEYSDIVVKPNLEKELGAEWGDGSQLLIKKETISATSECISDSIGQADRLTDSTVHNKPLSVAVENVKPQIDEPKEEQGAEFRYCPVKLTELLKAKPVKDITPADTTSYLMESTLVTHELQRGETIVQLAVKYYGDKRLWPYIVKYNGMKDFNNVAIGQKIDIPVLKEKSVE